MSELRYSQGQMRIARPLNPPSPLLSPMITGGKALRHMDLQGCW